MKTTRAGAGGRAATKRFAAANAAPPTTEIPRSRRRPRTTERLFPIAAIGASAGGLEAFSSLLQHIAVPSDMAFVLIQHLDPTHTSFLRDALVKMTKMKVQQAEDGMRVKPNHVYVIPPNTFLGIRGGLLTLDPRPANPKAHHLSVDFFFRALAEEKGSSAIGVVLSGTASDGTEGLRAIKEAGGITFAQDPKSAKFHDMPRSARDAGVVDYCLPIPELAQELMRLSRHPYVVAPDSTMPMGDDDALKKIFALVKDASRVDFSEYKAPTFERRLARRMALRRVDTLGAYLSVLEAAPGEVLALYEDSLIRVTSFFRDEEAFESLKTKVFPKIVQSKPEALPIRVWVAGCATGEEAYSLAIALVEFLGTSSRPVQIFGTDVSGKAIESARAGLYSDTALREVSEERRRRYFTKVDRGYRIVKSIRDLCVFVQHDLARDPPFSKLDLLSCRNVLIYFDEALQKRVVATFHYALSEPGFLLLGRAENVSSFKRLFQIIDRASKIFSRTAMASALRFASRPELKEASSTPRARDYGDRPREVDLATRLDRLLLARYVPAGIVVNEKMEILQFRGRTGAYLQPAPGGPQNNAMQMARDGLALALRATVAKAKKSTIAVRTSGVEVDQDGYERVCDVVAIPLMGPADLRDPLYVVLFEEQAPSAKTAHERGSRPPPRTAREKHLVPKLEEELAATKEYLQTLISEQSRTNEELGAANEELVSGNEELQSMNEELETAKEELQSINEELTTVNDELQSRNHEVTQVNGDLINLLTTVDIPILILDRERKIRRFTPKARRILNVVDTDVGRPLEDIKANINVADLDQQIAEVIESMEVRESEVQDRDGHWFRLQIRPYKTTENRIDGAILSLLDIDALKGLIQESQLANSKVERANRAKDEFLAMLSHELRTPLSSMLLRAQLLRRGGVTDPSKVQRAAEAIEAGVMMQVRLIDDLLDVSKIATGKIHLDLHAVDLAQVVATAIDALSLGVGLKSITLDADLARKESGQLVYGDGTRLQQIVTNLLTNAIKFSPTQGKIDVSLKSVDGNAVLCVKDNGIGIDPSFLPSVFDRFTQADTTSTRTYGGLGLGLAIVRRLVELHQGTVTAESPGTGMGTTFTVTLPLMKALRAPATDTHPAPATPKDPAVLGGLRILVVDDDRATREVIGDMLGQTGAEVRLAPSSADAIKVVSDFHPQLLICDIAMPGEDGCSFLRKVRAVDGPHACNIPALAFTALAREEDRERAFAAGFQMHVAKPVDVEHFTKAVVELATTRWAQLASSP